MSFPDVRAFPEDARWEAAGRIRTSRDIVLPPLSWWNYDPCPQHAGNGGPQASCTECGILFRRHQRVGVSWLYFSRRGLLADTVGSGKTCQIGGMLAACAETGELPGDGRAVIVARPAAVGQWQRELNRMVPGLRVIAVTGSLTPRQRVAAYVGPWDVCVVSFQTLVNKRGGSDFERLRHFDIGIVVFDDIDPMRHHRTATAYVIKKLSETASRVYGVHGTPQQKRLLELHSFLEPLGGREVFGTQAAFKRQFVESERVSFWTKQACGEQPCARHRPDYNRACRQCTTGHRAYSRNCAACRTGRSVQRTVMKDAGIRDGMLPVFREMVAPMVLRRRAEDIDDAALPAIQMHQVPIDLTTAQRTRYEELRQGVLRVLREEGEEVSEPTAMAAWLKAWQIASGLAAIDGHDSTGSSAKMDWVTDTLDGDLSEEKAVVFCYFRPNVQALSARLTALGIGHVVMWSAEQDATERAARLDRFRTDPECRALIGTTTIEQSLNLQAARHLILVDTIRNPARMEQIVGRIRRQGSAFPTVYVHWLLASGTHEDMLPELLGREQGLTDAIWGERSDVFESITPATLMRAIAGR